MGYHVRDTKYTARQGIPAHGYIKKYSNNESLYAHEIPEKRQKDLKCNGLFFTS